VARWLGNPGVCGVTYTAGDVKATWREDGLLAVLRASEDEWLAHLSVEQWYEDQQREPAIAWVVSWLDPVPVEPTMLSAAIEIPALTADDAKRRQYLIERALAAMDASPVTPAPFAVPAPTPEDADQWSAHLNLQLASWERAFGELLEATKTDDSGGELGRYRSLAQTLDWTYALDSSLGMLWKRLSGDIRERRSLETDARAHAAAAHNAAVDANFDLENDPAFAAYVRRQRDHQPYEQWSDVLLAGAFQRQFFLAIQWVRGQLIHAATSAPMDLRQFRPGAEPRWKWRESGNFARGRTGDAGCRAYDDVLAGHDVTGFLSHLSDVLRSGALDLETLVRTASAGN
jgi:hypothetical protein